MADDPTIHPHRGEVTAPASPHPRDNDLGLHVFVIGISGSLGSRLALRLLEAGTRVTGLVRTAEQRAQWVARGAEVEVASLASMTVGELATMLHGVTVVVYAAGSNGGAREVTDAIDAEGVAKTVAAAGPARIRQLILVSVMPEAWRDRSLDDDEEYYFAVKKRAEVLVTRSDLDWVILRPSLLVDEPATGQVSLGPAELHREIPRDDVAAVLAEMVIGHGASRQILELDRGSTPIAEAVMRSVSHRSHSAHRPGGARWSDGPVRPR